MTAHTEASVAALLRRRFYALKSGNGAGWAFVPSVRNAAGFDATRTADAVAMELWPSRGLRLHGFEIKVTRSDWLRELKQPEKAAGFSGLVDRWWLVVGDASIVRPGELPDGWGLLVASGERLVQKVEAQPLRPEAAAQPSYYRRIEALPPEFGRSFLAALLRAACRVGDQVEEQLALAGGAA